jgi:hypothetical protein
MQDNRQNHHTGSVDEGFYAECMKQLENRAKEEPNSDFAQLFDEDLYQEFRENTKDSWRY